MRFFLALLISFAWAEPAPKGIKIQEKPAEETPEVKPGALTDNEYEAIGAAMSAMVRTILTPAEKASSVRGKCSYRGGFCPGAVVELKTTKGELLVSQTLASVDGFAFLNLKPGDYSLEVSYPRYGLKAVQRRVSPGAEVAIELVE